MVLRPMLASDVDAVLDVQEPAAVAGLGHIFDQDRHRFPRPAVRARWLSEIEDPAVTCFVVEQEGAVAGFVAVSGPELRHFGTALHMWGTGLAARALEETEAWWRAHGVDEAWLWVFEENLRARRFYERQGWALGTERSAGGFPPYPVMVRYARSLTAP